MEKEVREKIALKRYQIISPVLAEPARAQNDYFRKQAGQEQAFPRYGLRKLSVSTLKTWLRKYRRHGFEALKPKERSDGGRPRRLEEALLRAIEVQAKAYPHYSVQKLYETLQELQLLGDPPVHYNTVLRLIKMNGWLPVQKRTHVRKAFEVEQVNDLWIGDFLHGPQVRAENRSHKAILCALIDDPSRSIVGHAFSASETINVLTLVLKEAFLAYGIPKRLYLDNGPAFSSDLLAKSCALAGVSLIHSKPYDSPSRGKVERFFRTVRERFLAGVQEGITLAELNQAFWLWLEEDYHLRRHSALERKPPGSLPVRGGPGRYPPLIPGRTG
jgi:putative transposase